MRGDGFSYPHGAKNIPIYENPFSMVNGEGNRLGSEALGHIVPLDSLRKRERMNSKHPMYVSCEELWDNFRCKNVCPSCVALSGRDLCLKCANCSQVCQNTVVLCPLVSEKKKLSKENYEDVIKSPLSVC